MINATKKQIEQAFTEWERLYREEPEKFMSDFQRFTTLSPKTYGESCSGYFIALLSGEV